MIRARKSWLVFSVCAVLVAGTLIWTSFVVLRLELAEQRASAHTERQIKVAQAMWRMDSWLSMFVAREAARPFTDYLPLGSRETPSPLLTFESNYIKTHFHIDPASGVTSPEMAKRPESWSRLRSLIDVDEIEAMLTPAAGLSTTKLATVVNQAWYPTHEQAAQTSEPTSEAEFNARVQCTVPPPPGQALSGDIAVDVGPLIPHWLPNPETDEHELLFVRQLRSQGTTFHQGFVGDWPQLRERLLGEIGDLFPAAQLAMVSTEGEAVDPFGRYLANIPVALITASETLPAAPRVTPVRLTLGLAWLVSLVAAVMVGLTLHKSLELGERRRGFVSAVTHEMRTPLTTFSLYSEMLADGVVSDVDRRQEYLETLKEESARLTTMVDNVLTHSRLEERKPATHKEHVSLRSLMEQLTPQLGRLTAACGMQLDVAPGPDPESVLDVDVTSVSMVLRNLVDNATKYARDSDLATVRLGTELANGSLLFRVSDNGPGIPAHQARAIFKSFDRGGRDPSDPAPGIGLGLALSRGLARDMGGDLTLENPGGEGACFRLEIPA